MNRRHMDFKEYDFAWFSHANTSVSEAVEREPVTTHSRRLILWPENQVIKNSEPTSHSLFDGVIMIS